ncbi:MAG: DUF2384 domain-containing protein [Deltaproteobacteria bacterium]|nr:DUF2384 domain-containing protein [Deltaproteobacteria bacterium]
MTVQQIAASLGGEKALHHKIKNTIDFDQVIRQGIPWNAGKHIKQILGLKDDQFADFLGMSVRTMMRRKSERRMSPVESDRLFRLAKIYTLAVEVFEDGDMAIKWLNREQIGLGGRRPLEMIQTEAGEKEVENLLGRIEYGVLD